MVIILALLVHKKRVDNSQQKIVSTQKNSDFSHKQAQIEGRHHHLPTKILPTPQRIDNFFFLSVPFFLGGDDAHLLGTGTLKDSSRRKGPIEAHRVEDCEVCGS